MKKLWMLALGVTLAAMGVSCSSSKAVIAKGDKEIAIPMSSPEYRSDANYWRVVQMGTSTDVTMAKKVALQNARQDLAATLQSQVSAVIENYGQNASMGAKSENETLYQELARTVVNQSLVGADLAGEKLYQTEDGSYRYHVCLQVAKASVAQQIAETLSEDERMKLEFDRERFQKIFDEEMAKVAQAK